MWDAPWQLTGAQIAGSILAGLVIAGLVIWALAAWLMRLDRDAANVASRQAPTPPLEEWVEDERRAVRWREVNR